ncbi:hypothetical protein FHU38_000974 [Saccharomonospora amisosensis]|uniref:Uncharacterized protein n=1 Tax=Saccharomonospora amisosensis TaxID=1128677 RepID=A0A7X5ZPU9_9PSEU|nr:hypothetical protein [Saccharomonospora amisosensis]NIJ10630.1 hypothetical protein [Saccharomonospora amisosensis]
MAVPLLPNQLDGAEFAVEVAWGADPNLVDTSSWVWSDITEDVRFSGGPIGITTGRGDEASQSQPAKCALTLDNTGGAYSLGGQSPNYPNVRRNTPVRVRVLGPLRGLILDGHQSSFASTPDAAALDILGDIDIRADVHPTSWRPRYYQLIASKYDDNNQASWTFALLDSGTLELGWSSDGVNRGVLESTVPVPTDAGRLSVRVTLDIDNGVGQHVITFYTADTIDGPWTQLGDAILAVGQPTIFSSTAAVVVGFADTWFSSIAGAFDGTVHRFQLRNGINGTVAADADFDTPTPGASSFTDSTGLPWTIAGNAALSAVSLFHGYATSWTPSWDLTGRIPTVTLTAAGGLRRLKQRTKPVQSTMFRQLSTQPEVVAYWPMEEGKNAAAFTSGLGNDTTILTPTGDVTFAASTDFVGSDHIPTVRIGNIRGNTPSFTGAADQRFLTLALVPEGGVAGTRLLFRVWTSSGVVRRWDVDVDAAGLLRLAGYDAESVNVFTSAWFTFNMNGRPLMASLWLSQVGANTQWQISTWDINSEGVAGDSYPTTYGRIVAVHLGDNSGDLNGTAYGHAAVLNDEVHAIWDVAQNGLRAWSGETAVNRVDRVARENQVPLVVHGGSDLTMGPQGLDTVLELLRECEITDQGVLFDGVGPGLSYRAHDLRENTNPALVIDAAASELAPVFAPVDDDQRTVNAATIKQKNGSQVTAADEASIAAIGLYDASEEISTDDAAMLDQYASWRLHLGSLQGYRYPQVTVDVRATPGLAGQVLALQPSGRIDVTGLGGVLLGHPADTVPLLVEGLSHSISPLEWTVTAQCSPYGPWRIVQLAADTSDTSEYVGHLDTDGSQLAASAAAGAVTLWVTTLSGPVWTTTPDDFPFETEISGWVVTVTACASAIADTFTRTVTSGWGTADSGQTWTTSGGSATDFSTSGTTGDITLTTVSVARWALLGLDLTNVDLTATVSPSAVATGDWITTSLIARRADASNYLSAQVEFKHTGNIGIGLYAIVGGTVTFLSGAEIGTYSAGAQFGVRMQVDGDTIRAKLWPAASTEPTAWTVSSTGADAFASGDTGIRAALNPANTNINPVVSWDDLTAPSMQRFTVNPLPAVLSAGASVSVHNPPVLGL